MPDVLLLTLLLAAVAIGWWLGPKGRHTIQVCLGTACYVRGGKKVLDAIKEALQIDVGETTEDRRFS
ncbi:NAD(P)H-dependent oxidoreductase subunit E, partial [Halomonas campaniensis]|uniref:NADH-quinone oxidoreductase subunit NuoE family protein n=1 Tax=Halomonas campaniensis TaxID=213554 RepID=UPI0039710828